MYKQTVGVSIAGYSGPVLTNIIDTQCENVIIDELYINDTLLVIRQKLLTLLNLFRVISNIFLNKFNSVNKNLKFTIDTFENCVPYFLDIEIFQQ